MTRSIHSPRGLSAFYAIEVVKESTGDKVTIDANSTALTLDKGIQLNGKTTARITGNSTGIVTNGKIKVGGVANATIGSNTTGVTVAAAIKFGTNSYIYENSTGCILKWKSTAKYITRNTTAN